jgi:hypothetical protein
VVVVNPLFDLAIEKPNGKVYRISGLASATVRMSRARPADECDLTFPNHADFTLSVFEAGDVVTLALGHKEFEKGVCTVFQGPITKIGPNLPLTITAEGNGTAARGNPYRTTYQGQGWKEIAADALSRAGLTPMVSGHAAPTKPPAFFRVDGLTPAQVLDKCCAETLWVWYVMPGTSKGWFGPRWEVPDPAEKYWLFIVGQNVFSDDCALEYSKKRGVKRVIVTLSDSEGQKAAVTGESRASDYREGDAEKKLTRAVSDPTAAAAEELAKEEYGRLAAPVKGSFTAVGNPLLKPGMKIAVRNPKENDAVSYVTVEEVEHTLAEHFYSMRVTVAGGGGAQQ